MGRGEFRRPRGGGGEPGESEIVAWLGDTGANGLPRWQSWLLGLEPADPASVVLCQAGETHSDDGGVAVGANINVQAGSGASVVAYLEKLSDGAWIEVAGSRKKVESGKIDFMCYLDEGANLGQFRIGVAVQ